MDEEEKLLRLHLNKMRVVTLIFMIFIRIEVFQKEWRVKINMKLKNNRDSTSAI
jgi:hypothetical protein